MITYRDQRNQTIAENVTVGKWTIRNRFYNSPPINQWGMIYFGPKPDSNIISLLKQFENDLPSVSRNVPPSFDSLLFGFFLSSLLNMELHFERNR